MEAVKKTFKLALIQMEVQRNKAKNVLRAKEMIQEAASNGANVVVLPEMFISNYDRNSFEENAEPIVNYKEDESATAARMLSEAAKENDVYVIGGSIPEKREDGWVYNTSACFNKNGDLAAKYSKMHLFDIDIPGKATFLESEFLKPGTSFATFDTEYCKFGLGICYDVRFPDFSHVLCREMGADFLIFPAAFTKHTGELHWDILRKGRAVDNQAYFAFCSPARPEDTTRYQTYGHSCILDPWGKILSECDHTEEIIYSDIDLGVIDQCRSQIPCYKQRRTDLYQLKRVVKQCPEDSAKYAP